MEDRVLAPAFVLLAAVLAISSPSKASAADPSGIWAKDDGSAKVEIKKCGRGLCGSVVWLRNSEQFARQAPARRQERERVPAWPADHRPSALQQHAPDSTQHLGGERLQSRRGSHLHGRQADARLEHGKSCSEAAGRGSCVARRHGPDRPFRPTRQLRSLSRSRRRLSRAQPKRPSQGPLPQPEAPMIEASIEREQLSAPGFTLVSTSASQLPLSGDDVLSMVAMTGVAPAPTTVAPSLTETAAAEEQWPWMQRRSARLASTRNCGPGPSRTRGAGSCEAKAEAVRHGIARAMALASSAVPELRPRPQRQHPQRLLS